MEGFMGGFVWPITAAFVIGLTVTAVTKPAIFEAVIWPVFFIGVAAVTVLTIWEYGIDTGGSIAVGAVSDPAAKKAISDAIDALEVGAAARAAWLAFAIYVGFLLFLSDRVAKRNGDGKENREP